jgi:hypothetical protein
MRILSTISNLPFTIRRDSKYVFKVRKQQRRIPKNTNNHSKKIDVIDAAQNDESPLTDHENYGHIQAIEIVTALSRSVDIARTKVDSSMHICADWRKKGMETIISLIEVYGTKDETAAHTVTLFDKFLAEKLQKNLQEPIDIPESSGQLEKAEYIAMAVFMLATKFQDTAAPCISDLVQIITPPCLQDQILKCEELVLDAIGWDLHVTTGAALAPHCSTSHPPLLYSNRSPRHPAFEIASELLSYMEIEQSAALRKHLDLLLLLAHFHPDMLAHSCRDIAAAAILAALRATAGPAAAAAAAARLRPIATSPAALRACAARLRAVWQSLPTVAGGPGPDRTGPPDAQW